ncbi:hypothetical protein CCMA1212_000615 [Trichoderma ghanense]|uniref:Uncharacterized protein n=1 Tax=Trichoderma ghanense TaxID=65468 RepID=A0ABY2HHJ2_9HYPO
MSAGYVRGQQHVKMVMMTSALSDDQITPLGPSRSRIIPEEATASVEPTDSDHLLPAAHCLGRGIPELLMALTRIPSCTSRSSESDSDNVGRRKRCKVSAISPISIITNL